MEVVRRRALLLFTWLTTTVAFSIASQSCQVNGRTYHVDTTITRDVCVIGGGSSGTYAAVHLRDAGESVVVVEKQDRIGGHTQTYTDPATGATIDVGVEVFHNISLVKDYFARFNVSLVSNSLFGIAGEVQHNVDFHTGVDDTAFQAQNFTAALSKYADQLAKYPYLEDGFDLPYPVPEDLLLSFGDFIIKYDLQSVAYFIATFAQGLGDVLQKQTLYVFKNFGQGVLNGALNGFLTTAKQDNSLLYEAAQSFLGSNVILNSQIVDMDRDAEDGAKILVKTPAGLTLITAQKVVFSIPPKLDNLKGFDLSENETILFEQFLNDGYYTGILNNTGIPDNFAVANVDPNTLYNLPVLPASYGLTPTVVPGLFLSEYGSTSTLPNSQVMEDWLSSVKRLELPGKDMSAEPDFVIFYSHSPFELTVSTCAIEEGFYKDLYALQGQRRTFYTGAAFHTQDSSSLWQFTAALLPRIIAFA